MREAIRIFKTIEKVAGLKINVDKTSAVWLGSKSDEMPMCQDLGIRFVKEFTLLGNHFKTSLNDLQDCNYGRILNDIEKLLKEYAKHNLTILGKITVINTLAIPKLVHVMSVLPNPHRKYIDQMKKLFSKFIWSNKRPKVAKKLLVQKVKNGGIRLKDVELFSKALKVKWVKRLYVSHSAWQNLFLKTFSTLYVKVILELDKILLNKR